MADEHKVERSKVKLKNVGTAPYVIIDADGGQHLVGPGVEREVELPTPQAERMKKAAEDGHGGLAVDGVDPTEARAEHDKNEGAPEIPAEHGSRAEVAAKETELMQAGQEAGKEQRDKMAKKDWNKLAGETGIGIMARGGPDALETVTAAPDSPPKAKK